MKILPITVAFLTILGALSYARLESFLQNATVRALHLQLHTAGDPGESLREKKGSFVYFNQLQHEAYNHHQKSPKDDEEEDEHAPEESEAEESPQPAAYDSTLDTMVNAAQEEKESSENHCSYFDLGYFKDPGHTPGDPGWQKREHLLSKLITSLYSDHRFFREAKERVPDLEHQLVRGMVDFLADRQSKAKYKEVLYEITFPNPEVHEVYTQMLTGTRYPGGLGAEGYTSLGTHFTVQQKKERPLSVYLAPPETLLALFDSPNIVEEILRDRQQIHRQLNAKNPSEARGNLALTFEEKYRSRLSPDVDPSLISFQVTKTKPRT